MVISPDFYLIVEETGEYVWSVDRVKDAWRKTYQAYDAALKYGSFKKVILLIGIPASGKSTWLRAHEERDTIYVDATFTTKSSRFYFLGLASEHNIPVEAVVMDTPIAVCMNRNQCRPVNRRVPDDQVINMNAKLQTEMPTIEEGFVKVTHVTGKSPSLVNKVSSRYIGKTASSGWYTSTPKWEVTRKWGRNPVAWKKFLSFNPQQWSTWFFQSAVGGVHISAQVFYTKGVTGDLTWVVTLDVNDPHSQPLERRKGTARKEDEALAAADAAIQDLKKSPKVEKAHLDRWGEWVEAQMSLLKDAEELVAQGRGHHLKEQMNRILKILPKGSEHLPGGSDLIHRLEQAEEILKNPVGKETLLYAQAVDLIQHMRNARDHHDYYQLSREFTGVVQELKILDPVKAKEVETLEKINRPDPRSFDSD
jgi:predicted kinase